MKIKKAMAAKIMSKAGGTFRLTSKGLVESGLTDGFFVSVTNYSIPEDQFIKGTFRLPFLYETALKAGYYLGFWSDNGKVYIDLTLHVRERPEAISIGIAYDQISIWDIKNQSLIFCQA